MSSEKTYIFPTDGGNGNLMSCIAPLLSQRGIDPSYLAMMNNGGWGNNNFIELIFLLAILGWGGNGNGFGFGGGNNNGAWLSNQISDSSTRELILQAINGNTSRIGELATTLNCSIGQVQSAINTVSTQILQVGNSVGMSSQQIINSIQAGNASIASQLASCCCDIKTAIGGVNVGLERGFSNLAFETQRQTCDLKGAIADSTAQIVAGQRAAEMRELQRDITERDRQISALQTQLGLEHQNAAVGQMITSATTPIYNAVGALKSELDSVKCKLPETATIPYSPVVGVPTCVAANYGLYGGFPLGAGAGFGTGFFG